MSDIRPSAPVVIYVNGGPCPETVTVSDAQATGSLSGAGAVYDPYQVHRDFPDRWSAYIRGYYRNIADVIRTFGCSERTARNWWNARSGASGSNVAIAVMEHGQGACDILFAEAA